MNKSLLLIPTVAFLLSVNAGSVMAAASDYGVSPCQPIYGGGDSCVKTPEVEINKTVQNPANKTYVDNLSVNDPKYGPTQTVLFKINVKNTTKGNLTNLTIKDVFPNVVEFAGGIGDYKADSRTLTIKLDKLDEGETRDFYVQAKVLTKEKLPADQNVSCVVNQAMITVGDKTAQDNAQFCIEKAVVTPPTTTKGGQPATPVTNPPTTKGGLPVYPPAQVKTTPQTGPESLALISLVPSALGGLYLRRKTK